jgi:hypothetical protein
MNSEQFSQCDSMVTAAREYCQLIDHCQYDSSDRYWLRCMEKLLPRLHTAVLCLQVPTVNKCDYDFPDDDLRCDLFLKLIDLLWNDSILWSDFDRKDIKQNMCECLADDFTDIYFDLRKGLHLLHQYPEKPVIAANIWHSSFYAHWGQHLMDAESWLHAVEARNYTSISAALNSFNPTFNPASN